MMRNIISTALVVALVLAGGQAMAVVTHFSDGFEAADGHTVVGAGTVGTNGWAITSGGGNNPAVIASSSGLTGQVADGTASGMVGGSGDASWVNSAGIAGGLDPSREYTLSWTQKVNIGNTPDVSGGLGFFNVNGINGGAGARAFIGLSGGTNWRVSTPQDTDIDFPIGTTDEIVADFKIVLNDSRVEFFIDGSSVHEAASDGGSFDAFGNASGIRTFIESAGHYDNVLLTSIPEPTSLILLLLAGMATLAVRRRRQLIVAE